MVVDLTGLIYQGEQEAKWLSKRSKSLLISTAFLTTCGLILKDKATLHENNALKIADISRSPELPRLAALAIIEVNLVKNYRTELLEKQHGLARFRKNLASILSQFVVATTVKGGGQQGEDIDVEYYYYSDGLDPHLEPKFFSTKYMRVDDIKLPEPIGFDTSDPEVVKKEKEKFLKYFMKSPLSRIGTNNQGIYHRTAGLMMALMLVSIRPLSCLDRPESIGSPQSFDEAAHLETQHLERNRADEAKKALRAKEAADARHGKNKEVPKAAQIEAEPKITISHEVYRPLAPRKHGYTLGYDVAPMSDAVEWSSGGLVAMVRDFVVCRESNYS